MRKYVRSLDITSGSNSSNLNPIENSRRILKSRLEKRWTREQRGPHSEDELWEAARAEWDLIPQADIDKLVDSVPQRLQAVVAAQGGHTKW